MDNHRKSLSADFVHDYRLCWKELAVADIVYKVLGFIILAPLVGILFRFFVSISGRSVLSDFDILFFFLNPIGWIALIVVGAVWVAIVALEQAALMAIVSGAEHDSRVRVKSALYFAAKNAWPVLRVTARMVAWGLLVSVPFLAAMGAIYLLLLNQHDINFYLATKPREFWIAGGLIGVVACALVVMLVRLLIGWLFALPLILFENIEPSKVLRESRRRTAGQGRTIVAWIVGWAIAATVVSALATGVVGLLGRLLVPLFTESLLLLAFVVGTILLLWGLVNLVVTLLSATTFSVLLMNLYRKSGSRADVNLADIVPTMPVEKHAVFRLSAWKLLGGSIICVLLAALCGVYVMQDVRLEDHTEITAHRGASAAAPENTMAAFERAIADGADWIELDVQETADGVVVVTHDSDFKRQADVDRKVWEVTAEELKDIDVGSWFNQEFSAERVPTLNQVLRACKGRIRVNIELKYYGHDKRLEEQVVEIVEANGMESDVVIMSLKSKMVQKVRALRPKWKVGLLSAVAVGDLTKVDVDFLAVSLDLAGPNFIRHAQGAGKEVYVWTVNDPVDMSNMIGRGANNLITDEPAMARSVLEHRAQLSSLERLLMEVAAILGASPNVVLTPDDA